MPDANRSLRNKTGAAKRLGISVRSLERLVAAGELGHVLVGERVMFHDDQIDTYIDAHTVPGRYDSAAQ
jgi:excisionase family DNA binding protein